MKKKLKEVYILFIVFLVISLPIVHLNYVIRLAKEQGEVRKVKNIVNESEELYHNRKIELENKVDLEKIEREAMTRFDMEVSNEIEYFKIK